MTDTPRTLAELDALYSDNNAGAISAQDLRDGFHSVANPVPSGGFEHRLAYTPDFAIGGSNSTPQSVANNTDVSLDAITPFHDPADMLQPGTYTSTLIESTVAGPGQWIRFPVGLWLVFIQVSWSDVTAGASRGLGVIPIDDRGALDPSADSFLYRPNFVEFLGLNPWGFFVPKAALTGFHAAPVVMPVTEAMVASSDGQSDEGDGWAVLVGRVRHDAGSPITVTSNFYALRIG